MRQWIVAAGLGLAASLAGCASQPTASAEDCANADWYGLGKADGMAGRAMTALNDEIMACRPHGIEPDLEAYKAGRAEGLKAWCQPSIILEAALRGEGDPFACEPLTKALSTAFETGRDTRQAVLRYQQLQEQVEQLEQRAAQIRQEEARLRQLYSQTADQGQRQQIAGQIDYLRRELQAVDAELDEAGPIMREEKAKYEAAVENYEAYKAGLAEKG